MTYSIYRHYVESSDFQRKLRSIQKKCERYGDIFHLVIHDDAPYTVKIPCDTSSKGYILCEMVDVEMVGSPLISGYELVGMLEHHHIQGGDRAQEQSTQNIVMNITQGRVHIPARYRTAQAICEHCRKKIIRTKTYLVRNVSTDEIMQVGSTCMKDYVGAGMSVDDVARFYDIEYDLAHLMEPDGDGGSEDIIRGSRMMETKDAIAYALAYIQREGYVKSSDFGSTKSRLWDCFWGRCEDFSLDEMKPYFDQASSVQAWAQSIDHSTCSDYMHNIAVALSTEYSRCSALGYIGAGVNTWLKEQEKIAQAKLSPSRFQGQVGDKLTVQIISQSKLYHNEFTVGYNHTVLNVTYKMTDADGNIYLWKTATCPFRDMSDNQRFTITGSVKEHSSYRGEEQTILTRCKVISAA